MITVDQVTVQYPGASRRALAGVSLVAASGMITAVVGPNGSGKSTLVRALLGRVALASGRVLLDGESLSEMSPRARARRIAVVPQREELTLPLRGREYVALGRHAHLGPFNSPTAEDRRAVMRAIELTDSADLTDRAVTELSGGEWQRLRIARALAQGGTSMVLDEPTAFLDIAHEMAVFELLAQLALQGMTVILVSHQLNLVARFAGHLVLLRDGAVAASGTAQEVMTGEILERVYHWPLVVTRDPAVGAPALVPLRGAARRTSPELS